MNCCISVTLPLALTLGVFREIPGRDKPMFVKALVFKTGTTRHNRIIGSAGHRLMRSFHLNNHLILAGIKN